jgi:uncharacterized protein (DUF433 family)
MRSVQKSLRIPVETVKGIEAVAEAANRDFSAAANELLEEAVRMRRCPGIVFTMGPVGRRATVAGTGMDVWEVIDEYKVLDRNFRRLQRRYHWLTEPQLRAALNYYRLYPREVDARISRERDLTPERIHGASPFMRPPGATWGFSRRRPARR